MEGSSKAIKVEVIGIPHATASAPETVVISDDEDQPETPPKSEPANIQRQGMCTANRSGSVGSWENTTTCANLEDITQNALELQATQNRTRVQEWDLREDSDKVYSQRRAMEQVLHILDRVLDHRKNSLHLLEETYGYLLEVKEMFPTEYDFLHVGSVIGNVISPLVRALFTAWDPLVEPAAPLPTITKWQCLLVKEAFFGLIWQHFVPAVSTAAESWNPHEPEVMLRVFEEWRAAGALPADALSVCVAHCVEPRLLRAVQAWDPTRDTPPVHQWVLPWHQIASSVLSISIYPYIRLELEFVLDNWQPQDDSAHQLLAAWREPWGSVLTAMLQEHVVPKLEHYLQAAPVELVALEKAWLWCVKWLDLLGVRTIGEIAGYAFLPHWLEAFVAWLNTRPSLAAVLGTLTQFKSMFSDEVLEETPVRDAFHKALVAVNHSMDVADSPPPPADVRYVNTEPRNYDFHASTSNQSLSELLELRCLSKGIPFVPVGKTRDGRPLYKIGDESFDATFLKNLMGTMDDLTIE